MQDIRQTIAPETETTVVCRPTGWERQAAQLAALVTPGLAVGIWLGSYLVTGSMRPSASLIWDGVFFGQITVPLSVWGLLYLTRARVVANEQGLRWRGCKGWRRAAWRDIVSYSNGTPEAPKPFRIATTSGTLVMVRGNWTSEAALRGAVERNAVNAQDSAFVVTQPEPRTLHVPLDCHYDTAVNRNILGWMETIHKYGLLAVAIYFALEWFWTHTLPGWGWLLTPTGLFVIAKQTLPLLWRPMYRATQPRLDDKVFADKDGVRFVTGGSETAIAWGDIKHLYSLGIRSVVVTRDGSEYDFLSTLTDCDLLKSAIQRHAVNARYRGWRTGILERRQVTSRDGRQSEQCVYRYRSYYNCWVLWLMTVFAAAIVIPMTLIGGMRGGQGSIAPEDWKWLSLFLLLCSLLLLWPWGNYWRGAIRTDEEGITQQTIFGRRFLPWGQVRAFRWRGNGDGVRGCVEGTNGTITFLKSIADPDRLVDEIAAHGVTVR